MIIPSPMSCTHSTSAVKLFVQLAPSRCSQPMLDFLWPRAGIATSRRAFRTSPPRSTRIQTATTTKNLVNGSIPTSAATIAPWRIPQRRPARWTTAAPSRPPVAYVSSRRYTQTAYNPQTDDDGNEMKLEITPRAAKRLSEIMRKDTNPDLALRIQVESGGCHGFQYLMSLVTLPSNVPSDPAAAAAEPSEHPGDGASSGVIREDDTIFTYSSEEGGEPVLQEAPKIILDQPSLELLKGSKVDFTMELIGSQFKIVDNPLATSSCGCGTSFDIKI